MPAGAARRIREAVDRWARRGAPGDLVPRSLPAWPDGGGRWIAQVDGAIGASGQATGLGVAIRDSAGIVRHVASRKADAMTNNEAEYSAMILALEMLRDARASTVDVVSDSEIVVYQMLGRFSVNSTALKVLHRRACALSRGFAEIRFIYVPRERNGLADALAREALWPDVPWAVPLADVRPDPPAVPDNAREPRDVRRHQLRRRR